MAKCIERMIKEYPVRKPLGETDPTTGGEEDHPDEDSIDNALVGM